MLPLFLKMILLPFYGEALNFELFPGVLLAYLGSSF